MANAVWGDCRGDLGFLGVPGVSVTPPQVLLPQGYPETVSPDCLQYQCWDAVGVGDGTSTITGATLSWVLQGESP